MQMAAVANNHPVELESHLIHMGLRLRNLRPDYTNDDFVYSDLWVILTTLDPGCRLANAIAGYDKTHEKWNLTNMLLADTVDTLRILAWQKTEDGAKGKRPPEPVQRPGVTRTNKDKVQHKTEAADLSKVQQLLEERRRRR